MSNVAWADIFAFDTPNQFEIEFVDISGDASSANGTNISQYSPGDSGYRTFTDPDNDYRMGVYEISNDRWDKFKAELAPVTVTGDPSSAYDQGSHWTGTNVPTNNVSWYEAAQFINWLNSSTGHQEAYKFTGTQGQSDYTLDTWIAAEAAGGTNLYRHKDAFYFMPTEDEWVKAAYWNGSSLQTYSNASPNDLVSGDPDPTKWNYDLSAVSEPWDVGSGTEELNGTFDMMGNVFEWMESPKSDPSYGTGSFRGLRGGSYSYTGGGSHSYADDYIASFNRAANDPIWEWTPLGFRVASVPEPATLGLLLIGGLALFRRKSR